MSRLLDLCDLVPGWLYALALVAAWGACILLNIDRNAAIRSEALVRAELAQLRESIATERAKAAEDARTKEAAMVQTQTKATDDLHKALAVSTGRAADLDRRLRVIAQAGAIGANLPQSAGPIAGGDDVPAARLSDVARADLVRLAESASDTAETLKTCQSMLADAHRQTQ